MLGPARVGLPALHSTVVIDGEGYWDGGLTANPPLPPPLYESDARDVIAVLLHPCRWPEEPTTASEISQRLTEISCGSAFFSELQGIALARRDAQRSLLAWGHLERRLRRLNLHVIDAPELLGTLNTVSKLNAQAPFFWRFAMPAGSGLRIGSRRTALRSAPDRLTIYRASWFEAITYIWDCGYPAREGRTNHLWTLPESGHDGCMRRSEA